MGARVLLAAVLLAGCGDGESGVDPDSAPVAMIDRFSATAGTLQVRDGDNLPGPGAAVDFDQAPFVTLGFAPDGRDARYYNFDVQPRVPGRWYELRDGDGALVDGQLPIIDALPGDSGYSDFHRVWRVTVSDGYVANTITSLAELEASGFAIVETDEVANHPVVPAGSTADVRIDGGDASLRRAWYRGQIAPYFRFAESQVELVSVGIFEGQVPLSYIYVMFNINPGEAGGGLPSGFRVEPGTDHTHNVLETVPGDPGYSPLWMVNVLDTADFDSVVDLDGAKAATLLATPPGEVNCPVRSVDGP